MQFTIHTSGSSEFSSLLFTSLIIHVRVHADRNFVVLNLKVYIFSIDLLWFFSYLESTK